MDYAKEEIFFSVCILLRVKEGDIDNHNLR